MNNRIKFGFMILVFSLQVLFPSILVAQSRTNESNQTNAGVTGGVFWAYNQDKTRQRTSSIDIAGSASVEKSVSNTKTSNINMNLITGTNNIDFFYDRYVKFVK